MRNTHFPDDTAEKPDLSSLQEAAEWYTLLRDENVSSTDKERWQAWLDESQAHQNAWQSVESMSQRFALLESSENPERVISTIKSVRNARISRRRLLTTLSTFGLFATGGWSLWRNQSFSHSWYRLTADASTAFGEIRKEVLHDGTQVWLNSSTALKINYNHQHRQLHLLAGEILVSTGKDSRPLTVITNEGELIPLGTEFITRQEENKTVVAVYDGQVKAVAANSAYQLINAGQQLQFTITSIGDLQELAEKRHWAKGLLVAQNMTLSQVVNELDNYHHHSIELSPEIANLPVTGVYPLLDIHKTLSMLEDTHPILVNTRLQWWVFITPK